MDNTHLSIEEEKLRNLIELATDGILIGSNDGIIIEANSTFCVMIGLPKEELVGKYIQDIPFSRESVEKRPFSYVALKNGETVVSERELVRPDGERITIEMRTKMMPDGTYQSIYRDISVRKKYELQLLKYAEELSKLNDDKDRFITILAHDLVSPFNTILGYLGLLTAQYENYDRAEIKRQLDIVHDASTKTYRLLQEILTWSRTTSGNMSFEPAYANLREISQKTVEVLQPVASNKRIRMINSIGMDIRVYTDANMLRIIIRNLLSNALKFTEEGGKVVLDATEAKGMITVSVKDTGNGIAPEMLEGLLNNVHNKATVGTSKEKGSGLGLVICKMLAEKQGGTIWVESELGKGSTFFVRIPRSKA